MQARRRILAVIGPGSGATGDEVVAGGLLAAARDVGRLAVESGFRIATGGLGGVMEAASQGARDAKSYREGDVIGILKSYDRQDANRHVDIVIPSGMGIARNLLLVSTADVVVAIAGGSGTLSELALAWQLGRPIVALKGAGWAGRLAGQSIDGRRAGVILEADTPADAVRLASESTTGC